MPEQNSPPPDPDPKPQTTLTTLERLRACSAFLSRSAPGHVICSLLLLLFAAWGLTILDEGRQHVDGGLGLEHSLPTISLPLASFEISEGADRWLHRAYTRGSSLSPVYTAAARVFSMILYAAVLGLIVSLLRMAPISIFWNGFIEALGQAAAAIDQLGSAEPSSGKSSSGPSTANQNLVRVGAVAIPAVTLFASALLLVNITIDPVEVRFHPSAELIAGLEEIAAQDGPESVVAQRVLVRIESGLPAASNPEQLLLLTSLVEGLSGLRMQIERLGDIKDREVKVTLQQDGSALAESLLQRLQAQVDVNTNTMQTGFAGIREMLDHDLDDTHIVHRPTDESAQQAIEDASKRLELGMRNVALASLLANAESASYGHRSAPFRLWEWLAGHDREDWEENAIELLRNFFLVGPGEPKPEQLEARSSEIQLATKDGDGPRPALDDDSDSTFD